MVEGREMSWYIFIRRLRHATAAYDTDGKGDPLIDAPRTMCHLASRGL